MEAQNEPEMFIARMNGIPAEDRLAHTMAYALIKNRLPIPEGERLAWWVQHDLVDADDVAKMKWYYQEYQSRIIE